MKKLFAPILWILGFQVVSGLIGFVTRENMTWYRGLEKSSLTPPDLVFPIVWTCLYVMLALAGYFVWRARAENRDMFLLYWVQMALNWGWSFVFFGMQMMDVGFFWIVVLDIAMLAFIWQAWGVSRKAALLVVPTLLWGSFAGYLSGVIWILN